MSYASSDRGQVYTASDPKVGDIVRHVEEIANDNFSIGIVVEVLTSFAVRVEWPFDNVGGYARYTRDLVKVGEIAK